MVGWLGYDFATCCTLVRLRVYRRGLLPPAGIFVPRYKGIGTVRGVGRPRKRRFR
jgi:hypothetical protein